MRSISITRAGTILLVLAFITGMAGAVENASDNETNVTGSTTETLTVNQTETGTTTPGMADDDEDSGEGLIGPGNALYGLQIAFDNIGEVFIFNESEKLGKQVSNARKRIAEARAALKRNDSDAANRALAEYDAKAKDINKTMSRLTDKDTGFIKAQMMILKHQQILANLSISHPDNKGLLRAYNNSRELQDKFVSKRSEKPDLSTSKGDSETADSEQSGISPDNGKPEKGTKRNAKE